MLDFDDNFVERPDRGPDPQEQRATEVLRAFFEAHCDVVFTSRQVEVLHEREFFHWVTNRAVQDLVKEGALKSEMRELAFGGSVKVLWHRGYRYPRRVTEKLLRLVNEY